MPASPMDDFASVTAWMQPLSEEQVCGPNLEYDEEFLALLAATGKPESQFGRGEPADWAQVCQTSESLFRRTRDLRVALWWGRAKLRIDGFGGLPETLALLLGLLERFWDAVHPLPDPDDPDAVARLSVLGALDKLDNLLGDIRESRLSGSQPLASLRVRDVEVALGKLPPRANEASRSRGEIDGLLAESPGATAQLRQQTHASLELLRRLHSLVGQRWRADLQVDLRGVRSALESIESVLPVEATSEPADAATETESGGDRAAAVPWRSQTGVYSIETRQEAIRAIELVCAYLERHEPTNPAQLLLRRAARVIDKSFLQLVRELAPDAVKDVARIMGVDPSTITDQN